MRRNFILHQSFQRLNLTNLKEKFSFVASTQTQQVKALDSLSDNSPIIVNGWINSKARTLNKKLQFTNLRDVNGDTIQLVDSNNLLGSVKLEDVVQVFGSLQTKKSKNKEINKAEKEIKVSKILKLNKSNEVPSQLKTADIIPAKYRYLTLRQKRYQDILKKRSEIISSLHNFLNARNFIEIETPYLFKSTPEGANEFLVPSRQDNEGQVKMYALPQSPQQYKQLLMSSGINKYYQVARCFRDEDLRKDRQPEFTQLDIECSFLQKDEFMSMIGDLIACTWNKFSYGGKKLFTWNKDTAKLENVTEQNQIKKITYNEAMTVYGIDKPDLRAPNLKIIDLQAYNVQATENPNYPVFEVLILRRAFASKQQYSDMWSFLSQSDNYYYRQPSIIPILKEEHISNWYLQIQDKISHVDNWQSINEYLDLQIGDIICCSTRQPKDAVFENPTPLGKLRQLVLTSKIGKNMYFETSYDVAQWVVDFPLFSPVEKEVNNTHQEYPVYAVDTIESTHHPFTMARLEDIESCLLNENPKKWLGAKGMHYDMVINGIEAGGGSVRVHDEQFQRYIFEKLLKIKNYEELFAHLLRAFAMGTPPHCGIAFGLDRLCAMLCNVESIRDVIAFPKSSSGSDPVVNSPSTVSNSILHQYHLVNNNGSDLASECDESSILKDRDETTMEDISKGR